MERKRLKVEALEEIGNKIKAKLALGSEQPKKSKGGRPSKYKPEFARIAAKHCALGATDSNLADLFEVAIPTIELWYSTHPEFGEAVRNAKATIYDAKVERSLAQRAIGYAVDTEEIKVLPNGKIIRVPYRKQFPPDTTACIFWLKNRNPEAWRDVHRYEHSGKLELDKLTSEQLLTQIRQEAEELGILPPSLSGVARASSGNGKVKH